MRLPSTLALLVPLAVAGCAHAPIDFAPARPDQAVPDDPDSAAAEANGVRMVATAGDWRGWPDDLQDYLTPVEVLVENHSGKAIRINHRDFDLVDPGGFHHPALSPRRVQRIVAGSSGSSGSASFHYGWYGPYPWPGFAGPEMYGVYPYTWSDVPWSFGMDDYSPPSGPSPAAGPEGALDDGGRVAVLLFFRVPSSSLPRFQLSARLVDKGGKDPFGAIRLDFVRSLGTSVEAAPAGPTPPGGH